MALSLCCFRKSLQDLNTLRSCFLYLWILQILFLPSSVSLHFAQNQHKPVIKSVISAGTRYPSIWALRLLVKIERIAVRTSMFAHSNILSRYHIPRAKFPNPLIHPSIRSTTDSSFMAICQYYTVRIQNILTGTVHLTHIITVAVIKTNAAMSVHSTAFLSRISSYLNGKYSISPASKLNKPIHFSHYEMDEPVLSFWLFHFPVILSHWQLLFLLLL